ncbi:MAG: TM2 domain-containing protein [Oscillospiraceae bacterium]
MYCRHCGANMVPGNNVCQGCRTPSGIGSNFCSNCGTRTSPEDTICANCKIPLNQPNYYAQQTCAHSRIVAGVLAILIGYLGIHNFYLGYNSKAIAQLLLTLIGSVVTCGIAGVAVWIWSIVEGIQILTGSINVDGFGIPLKE